MFTWIVLGGAIGDCTTDSFVVSSSGRKGSPAICGTNTGQHSNTIHYIHANPSILCYMGPPKTYFIYSDFTCMLK